MSRARPGSEADAVIERYGRRQAGSRYSFMNPEVLLAVQERQRVMMHLFSRQLGWTGLSDRTLVEVGCGDGGNLLEFLRFGFVPENLSGIELLPERIAAARRVLPEIVAIQSGDANSTEIEPASRDIVFQSVVFSSLLDDCFQEQLARRMWSWAKPGGGVLWYDFIFDNPANPDVRGVPLKRVRELFPDGAMIAKRVTLAPPISRRVCRIHPYFYHFLNAIPLLRTHVLCWIGKKR